MSHEPINLDSLREVASQKGHTWKSLEDLAGTDGFNEFVEREFPKHAAPWFDAIDRRQFLKLMGASAALAGLAACRPQVSEKIVPYVKTPEEVTPGLPLFYASSFVMGGYANGILVETHEGRPTKIEGNPLHPGSMGATDLFAQASVLGLYDPDRSQAALSFGNPTTLDGVREAFQKELSKHFVDKGARVRILTELVTSPSMAAQISAFLKKFPAATWHQYQPVNCDNAFEGAKLAFGKPVDVVYHFDKAKVVVSLDSDFMTVGPGRVRYMWDFAEARRVGSVKREMNRMYAVESTPTVTGTKADNRVAMRSCDVEVFAKTLAGAVGVQGGGDEPGVTAEMRSLAQAIAQDLSLSRGASVVIAGDHQSASVHAIANAMNAALGNIGNTVELVACAQANPMNQGESLKALTDAMGAGKVDALIILGGNPAYSAPADLNFAQKLATIDFTAHQSLYVDETSALCKWHVPMTHDLEAWGDARAFDGTASVIQPTIEPLYGAPSSIELLEGLNGGTRNGLQIVRDTWKQKLTDDKAWRKALHDGVIGDRSTPVAAGVASNAILNLPPHAKSEGLEVVILPDPSIYDGTYSNNGWLQEVPKALTSLTWDNVVKVSPNTADRLGIAERIGGTGSDFMVPIIEVRVGSASIKGPALITPGQADDSLSVSMGFGRTKAGVIGKGIGFDVNALRSSASAWIAAGAQVTVTSEQYNLATTQNHYNMQNRRLVRSASLEEFKKDPAFAHLNEIEGEGLSMYPPREYKGNSWGMVIDTTVCTGCNACVVACQSENNIPIVGKEQVVRGREMHWLRIDRYYQGNVDAPVVHHLPVLCMHCEQAPCEVVCPVAATVHGSEGLNEMVYNRCVGTRYCSNNCPYKVRRFNFRFYTGNVTTPLPTPEEAPVLKLVNNPNVTVRGRGIMEKCSYCVQRINRARRTAKRESRPIRDGEVVTACQAACPTKAIIFGNINDKKSKVAKAKAEAHNYSLLKELNTRPRTTYLAKVTNPNPNLVRKEAPAE